jgi:hypothetical protein
MIQQSMYIDRSELQKLFSGAQIIEKNNFSFLTIFTKHSNKILLWSDDFSEALGRDDCT